MKVLTFIILFLLFFIPLCSAEATVYNFDNGNLSAWTMWGTGPDPCQDCSYNISSAHAYNSLYGIKMQSTYNYGNTNYYCINLYKEWGNKYLHFDYKVSSSGSPYACVRVDNIVKWTGSAGTWTHEKVLITDCTGNHEKIDICIVSASTEYNYIWIDNCFDTISTLSGYVNNSLGNSVSAATITLNNSGGSTTSNDTGYYEITGISSGTYSITATSPTHNDYSDTVSITADTEKNITMTRLTPALSNVGIIDSSESTLRIGWEENAVVDSVRIYQGTNTNLIATKDTSYVSLASYTVGNLDADTGYNFWLEPWDGSVSGIKYYVTGTTDGDGGGGGGGDPTPTATGTPGPTAPPYTNYTDEDWLNLTRYEQEYILFEHDQLNITIGTYTPKAVNLSFWYLILFLGICSTAYGSQKKNGELLFTCGLVAVVISMIKLGLF